MPCSIIRLRRESLLRLPRMHHASMGQATRWLLALTLWFVAIAPAMANPPFKSEEDFSQWLTFYYQNPEPKLIPDAVRYMSQSGILDNDGAIAPIFGFLSGTFRDNPDKMASWVKQLNSLKEQHFGVVILGVWYAALPESRKTVYALLEKRPKLKANFAFLYTGEPMSVEQIPLEEGPWVLDALWGKFMATGNSTPVERIITTLPWVDAKGDTNRLLIGGAANWSLTSNAVQHKRVLDICEGVLQRQGADVSTRLEEVIKNARQELQDQHNPAVNTGTAR